MVGVIAAGTLASLDAEARRVGGGRSIGRQSNTAQQASPPAQSSPSSQQATQAQRAQPAPVAGAAGAGRSRWLGPIAGLAAGLGIAALLSHFGLGGAFAGAMANIIVIAVIAMLAIWLIRKFMARKRDADVPAYANGSGATLNAGGAFSGDAATPSGSYRPPQRDLSGAPALASASSVPANFDQQAFLRNAKVHFVRLQAAWDVGNMDDIREFATPEMFAEVKVDLDSRGAQANQTDVVQLNAELLGVEDRGNEYLASVRFSGLIRETADATAAPFVEVWNLSKSSRPGEGWMLAGIQQVAVH
jgi:predicted lipid-binding transport protein (Tim44 family)